jgi:outer membrane receptor protein involved in Fe transport
MKLRTLATLIILLTNIAFATAQKGTLRGKIIDEETGETLIGATIRVKDKTIGTISDFDGNYSLNLSPGNHTIQISFVSYETKTFHGITIEPGEVTVLNANLGKAETEIQEVVVTAKARGTSENAMQVMQKKSAKMMDGISYEQISGLGDATAAQALKRVTGVSVQDDKYVYVRGLTGRYTKTTLNGADIPALDPEKNAVQMDIFPSNIIENIQVNKTFTPDMPGESTGGHVDIVTKDFPTQFTMQVSSSFGFNPQANLNSNFLSYPGSETDWMGFDNGTRNIPGRAQQALDAIRNNENLDQISLTNFSIPELNDITNSFNTNMAPVKEKSFLDHKHKLSIGDQVDFLGKALGYNAALSYSRSFSYYENADYNVFSESNTPDPYRTMQESRGKEKVNIAGLLNLNYKLSNNHMVGLRFLKNQSGTKVSRYQDGYFYYERMQNTDRNLGYIERAFDSYQVHGKNVFPSLNKMVVDWMASYSAMTQEEPDLRFFENLYEIENGEPTDYKLKTNTVPVRYFRNMDQNNLHSKIDVKLPLQFLGEESSLKFGGEYASKNRDLNDIRFEIQYSNEVLPLGDVEYFLNNYVITPSRNEGFFYYNDRNADLNNSYQAEQTVTAGYAMIDFKPSDQWRIVTGLRIENSDIYSENKVDTSDQKFEKGSLQETDLLPSLNITWSPVEDMNVRFAASRTLARPKFKEIGTNYYDYQRGYYVYGNPDLERTLISNLDLRWEYFFKRGEKIAISGFYKDFQNPIEQKLLVETQNYEIKYVNSADSYLYGAEVEFSKKLDFITALENFSVGGNITFVKSVLEIPDDVLEDIRVGDPGRKSTRPMLGQAPYIVNAHLSYENTDMGLKSSVGFNINGEKLLVITKGSTPYIYEQPKPSLNFNVSKQLGDRWAVDLSADNLLDADYAALHHFNSGDKYTQRYREGRSYSLGISYNFK